MTKSAPPFRGRDRRFRNTRTFVHLRPERVFSLRRNRCSSSNGMDVQVAPEWVFNFDRNQRSTSRGISVQVGPEYSRVLYSPSPPAITARIRAQKNRYLSGIGSGQPAGRSC